MERAHVKVHFAKGWTSKPHCTKTCPKRKSIERVCLDQGFCDATCLQINLDNLVGIDIKDIVLPHWSTEKETWSSLKFRGSNLFCIFREDWPFLKATLTWIWTE